MNISHSYTPRVLAPLHDLWRWLSQAPSSQAPASENALRPFQSFETSSPTPTNSHRGTMLYPGLTTRPSHKPLRIVRVLEANHAPANVGRMVISGRMADVCAELDRLAAREAALH